MSDKYGLIQNFVLLLGDTSRIQMASSFVFSVCSEINVATNELSYRKLGLFALQKLSFENIQKKLRIS